MAHLHTCNPHVLVLEDNEFQRLAAIHALRSIGVTRITAAASAEQALDYLSNRTDYFDATICDLRLEGMDGLTFLRSAPAERLGTIVLTSALSNDIHQASLRILRRAGAKIAGCLPKPIDTTDLKLMLLAPSPARVHDRGASVAALLEKAPVSHESITEGLNQHQFICHFQPKITLKTGAFCGAEALVRWQHPESGLLQPGQFIEQVQTFGMIDALTCEVLAQACELIVGWPKDLPSLHLSVNISATSLQSPDSIDRWRQILDNYWVLPTQITLEMTETTFVANDLTVQEALTRLRIAGFGVSLDDFGTGFTSLQQLRTLPVTELKIDRSFVHDASAQSRPAIILDSLIGVAKRLRISTVAEGIETLEDATYLTDLGCQTGQGYHFSRPLAPQQLIQWVRNRSQSS